MSTKIELKHVYKVFGTNAKRAIELLDEGCGKDEILAETGAAIGVRDASFSVEDGEIVVVMGLSGSGKSTLARCINRLFEPTSGQVFVDGEDVTALDAEALRQLRMRKFGMVFQRFALLPHRTVLQNAAFGLEIQKVSPEVREKKAREALAVVGLEGWENSYPEELSGGMQQRVGLARALAIDPDILLMDEAFSALDPLIRRDMQEELLSIQERVHKTIVFITHDLDEALLLGDRIVIMKDGAIVQIGPAVEILTKPANEYVERFVESVDITKVLTAKAVMKPAASVTHPGDEARVALAKMEEEGLSSLLVVDGEKKLSGIINEGNTRRLLEGGGTSLESILEREVTSVTPATPMTDLLSESRFPIAVVDRNDVLLGVVVRRSLLDALTKRGGY